MIESRLFSLIKQLENTENAFDDLKSLAKEEQSYTALGEEI